MALQVSLDEFRSSWRAEIHGDPAAACSLKRRRAGESPEPGQECERAPARLPGSPPWDGAGRRYLQLGDRPNSTPEPEKPNSTPEPERPSPAWRRLPGSPPRDGAGCRYLELAERLLEDRPNCTPKPERPSSAPEPERPRPASAPGGAGDSSLVEQLISDLNEINEIPFFDIQLPYEIALKIFRYLGRRELGRCAQVSKTWKVLAEDQVLWYMVCQMEGYLTDTSVTAFSSWKEALGERRIEESVLRTNWKNRIGAVSQLHYELGKVLCDVHSCDGVVVAGYTSGDVRLWDTRASGFSASFLETTQHTSESGLKPQVSFVRINGSLAVATYDDGTVDVWSLLIGREPIHRYQHNQKIQALALSPETAAIATASGFQIKVECPDERGYWHSTSHFQIQKLVNFLHLVHDSGGHPVAIAAAEEMVYLLKAGEPKKTLHSTYGQPVTCLDVSFNQAAFGVKSFGWFTNDGNKIHVYNLQTGQCSTTLGNSTGDFTCINLKDSPPHLLVTGNKDRRHPVRYIWFNSHSLVTANIPDEKNPRGASIMDDDLTAHRRHRGTISVYEFAVEQRSHESILPICRSSYIETTGYNYNIGLAVPYDLV
ncbi:F-box/WD repeat-containing protein 8 isoform X2 [Ascaphus truei]|uniref:F-box/WD repeat-containing protein 8 isoform X2 n=1 Tax=Ascaphus truei TaxID=8439 RepID=UPI003F5A2F53